ncbi:MAG: hypothetical protein U0W65_00095 [Bacteroidia bacterium]
MKLQFFFFLFVIILFNSCKLILGISDPKIEDKKTLNKYLAKINIDSSNCYVFYKPAFDSIQKLPYKPNWPVGFRPIQFKVFNSLGNLIGQYASCEGSYKKLKIFESYPPRNVFKLDSLQNFESDIKMYRTYYGDKVKIAPNNNDLNFVIYWGKWMGRFGKNLLKEIYKYKKEHPEYKINIIKVNVAEFYIYK